MFGLARELAEGLPVGMNFCLLLLFFYVFAQLSEQSGIEKTQYQIFSSHYLMLWLNHQISDQTEYSSKVTAQSDMHPLFLKPNIFLNVSFK